MNMGTTEGAGMGKKKRRPLKHRWRKDLKKGERITFASTVRLEDETGKDVRYWIVGSDEADPARGRISVLAPLARTLIGKRVGDSVTVQLPGGKKTFEILEVNFPWSE